MSDEKTEEPSSQKIRKAKEQGQFAFSKDFASATALIGATLGTAMFWPNIVNHGRAMFQTILDPAYLSTMDSFPASQFCTAMGVTALWMILPSVMCGIFGGFLGGLCQIGVNFSAEPLVPKFDRLNPVDGFKRIFSIRALLDVAKALLKLILIPIIAYTLYKEIFSQAATLFYAGTEQAWRILCQSLMDITIRVGALLALLGSLDVMLQIFLHTRDQKMSIDEVKREYKENEGDPVIKGQRMRLAREAANEAPKRPSNAAATVIVTNPTHYAVALRYHPQTDPVPVIVDKGVDEEAARIREQAEAMNIPIVQDPPTARALYLVPTGTQIPEELFDPIAKILVWLQSISEKSTSSSISDTTHVDTE
jgi:type III secretion protein U